MMMQDIKYALRSLRRSPVFTLTAILTLTIGIGANVAVYSVVKAVLLKQLPVSDPDRLVAVGHLREDRGPVFGGYSPQDYADLRAAATDFSAMASYWFAPGVGGANLTGIGEPVHVETAMVDGDLFQTLGVQAARGRTFGRAEDVPGKNRVAVIGDGFWRRQLGGDPSVIGKTVRFDEDEYTIIGVMPRSFTFPSAEAEIWLPISLMTDDQVPHIRGVRWLDVVGRLAPGIDPAAASTQASALLTRLEQTYPESNKGWGRAAIAPLREHLIGDVRPALMALAAAVVLVLLIACVNVSHLLLVRGVSRGQELGIRVALGATWRRLAGQLLIESAVLGIAGGALGIMLAIWSVPALVGLAGNALPRAAEVRIDAPVMIFAILVSMGAFVLFGVLPAARASFQATRQAVRGLAPRRRFIPSSAVFMLTGESALTMLVLCGTALTLTSLWRLTHVEPGFQSANVVSFHVSLQSPRYNVNGADHRFRAALLDRLQAIPGVVAVGGSKRMPLTGGGERYSFQVPRNDGTVTEVQPAAGYFIVTPGYFSALQIPLLRGREFVLADSLSPFPFVVSEGLAKQTWPGQDALGQRFKTGNYEGVVVGIAADVHQEGLAKPAAPVAYVPFMIFPRSSLNVFVRVSGSPLAAIGAIRQAVRELDPDLPISDLGPMPVQLGTTISLPRLFTLLLVLFGGAALVLAMVGVYGVAANAVVQRRQEIGIRMALGAVASEVVRMVLRQTMRWAIAGAAVGLALFLVFSRIIKGLLFGVNPTEPAILLGGVIALLIAAAAAAYVPARGAARVDPMLALRRE
jgi:predicted permease